MIRNRKLAHKESIQFIRYLQKNFPVPDLEIKFQTQAVAAAKLPNGTIFSLRGSYQGTEVIVSTVEQAKYQVQEELRLIAHECRHAIQHRNKMFPVTFVLQFAGKPTTLNWKAEKDADTFAAEHVMKFLSGTVHSREGL